MDYENNKTAQHALKNVSLQNAEVGHYTKEEKKILTAHYPPKGIFFLEQNKIHDIKIKSIDSTCTAHNLLYTKGAGRKWN